jgi:ubiquinone/menaquinone biosynthesis C-methylase UbiE
MINLAHRSTQTELLDAADLPFEDVVVNMNELNFINTWLGGHGITLQGFLQLLQNQNTTTIHVCEIGCGGGDNLYAIAKWCKKKQVTVRFTGIDIKQACVTMAAEKLPGKEYQWMCSDYADVDWGNDCPDIIFSSLFCHHFTNEAIVSMLQWMSRHSRLGFFINDLHRHRLAYYSIKWLTQLFSRSYLVKNDAPASVTRGFTIAEWKALLSRAEISRHQVLWKWAFRHLIVCKHAS